MPYFLSVIAGAAGFHAFNYFPHLTGMVFAASLLLLARRGRYLLAALVALGALYAFARYEPPASAGKLQTEAAVSGFFAAPAQRLTGGFGQEFRPLSGLPVKSIEVLSGREFEAGRRYYLVLKTITPTKRLNPGSRESSPYAVLARITGEGDGPASVPLFVARMRQRLDAFIRGSFEPDSAALLMAVTTGQRSYLSPGLREAFNRAGLAHLLSISGTHFAFFFVLLFGAFRAAIKYLPARALERLTLYLTPSQAAAALSLPFMLFYLGISGASIPSIRAFIMISLFLFGLLAGRRGQWLNFLVFAAFALVLWEPEVIFSVSFQLSFASVLFIGFGVKGGVGGPKTADSAGGGEGRRRLWARLARIPVKSLLITISASVGAGPLVAYYFHYLPMVSPLSNLVVTPLVGFVLVPLSLTGSFLYLLTGSFVTGPLTAKVAGLSVDLVRAFASVPHCSVGVPPFPPVLLVFFYGGLLLFALYGRRRLIVVSLAPVLLYAAFAAASPRGLSVTFLDAGQADASVVELPGGGVMVVDTGRSGKEVADYLAAKGLRDVDVLVLSHRHPDHTGGAGRLMEGFRVGQLWDSGRLVYPQGFLEGVKHAALKRGDVLDAEGYSVQVMHPYKGFYTAWGDPNVEENNDSLVLRLKGRKAAFLFAGDVEEEAEDDLSHMGPRLRSDVLKVPHHGLRSSVHEPFLAAVAPQVAVVNSWRLDEDLAALLKGCRILRPCVDGAVKVEELRGGGISVKTWEGFRMKKTRDVKVELNNIKRLFTTW